MRNINIKYIISISISIIIVIIIIIIIIIIKKIIIIIIKRAVTAKKCIKEHDTCKKLMFCY